MRRRRAFTLVEVFIALALILFLSGALLSYLYSLLDRRDRLVEAAAQQSAAAAVFDLLEHDLTTTFATSPSGEAGITGDETSITVRCRGTNLLSRGADLSDLQGTELRFQSGELSARRLSRTTGGSEMLASGVERLRLRYFDGREWHGTFDSAGTGELPVAVEAALWFGEPVLQDAESTGPDEPTRAPDRVRTMVVPDGPVAAWKAGA